MRRFHINSVILSVLLAANFQIERCNKGVWVGLAPGQTNFLGLTIGFQLNSGDLASQCFICLPSDKTMRKNEETK